MWNGKKKKNCERGKSFVVFKLNSHGKCQRNKGILQTDDLCVFLSLKYKESFVFFCCCEKLMRGPQVWICCCCFCYNFFDMNFVMRRIKRCLDWIVFSYYKKIIVFNLLINNFSIHEVTSAKTKWQTITINLIHHRFPNHNSNCRFRTNLKFILN